MTVDALNSADWIIITVLGLSTLLSLLRGFIREALSLVGWVMAFLIAMVFSDRLATLLANTISDDTGRQVVAFALLFVSTLIAAALLGKLLQSLIEMAGLSVLDRLLGMAFGFARGVFILLAAVAMLRGVLDLDRFLWWQNSVLLPHLLLMEGWFRSFTTMLSAWLGGAGP